MRCTQSGGQHHQVCRASSKHACTIHTLRHVWGKQRKENTHLAMSSSSYGTPSSHSTPRHSTAHLTIPQHTSASHSTPRHPTAHHHPKAYLTHTPTPHPNSPILFPVGAERPAMKAATGFAEEPYTHMHTHTQMYKCMHIERHSTSAHKDLSNEAVSGYTYMYSSKPCVE